MGLSFGDKVTNNLNHTLCTQTSQKKARFYDSNNIIGDLALDKKMQSNF